MRKRVFLLVAFWVILSMCLSPRISYVPQEDSTDIVDLMASRAGLYVPPARFDVSWTPVLTGSVSTVAENPAKPKFAPISIDTPETEYITVNFDGDAAFLLQGTGEPNTQLKLVVNEDPSTQSVATIDSEGHWRFEVDRENIIAGAVACTLRYADDSDSKITWRSRITSDLPELRLPAFVANGSTSLAGAVTGDVRIEVLAGQRSLPCIANADGSVSIFGVADLPAGTEIRAEATDALGNSVQAICMVVAQDSSMLQFALNAPQIRRSALTPVHAGEQPLQASAANSLDVDPLAALALRQGGDAPRWPPETATPDPKPIEQAPMPTVDSTVPGESVAFTVSADASVRSTATPAPNETIQPQGDSGYFPTTQQRGEIIEAYATLQGLTLPEIDDQTPENLFGAEVRKQVREVRRQMVLPVDLATVGLDGLEIPLMARGYRVGSIWIDPSRGISPTTKTETEGYVLSLELKVGELRGKPRLQIVHSPRELDPLKAQGWQPITQEDATFYDFDGFVDATGEVLVYASVPIRFDISQAEIYHRAPDATEIWSALLQRMIKAQ